MKPELPTNQWAQLDAEQHAATWSEAMLEEHRQHRLQDPDWRPDCSTANAQRAYEDALRAMITDLPNPTSYARWIEVAHPEIAETIRSAERVEVRPGVYRHVVPHGHRDIRLMERLGIIALGDRHLGAWAFSVRRALLGEGEE